MMMMIMVDDDDDECVDKRGRTMMAMLVPAANREKGSVRYLLLVQRSNLQNIAGYYKVLEDMGGNHLIIRRN